jgi:hypothetical protein
MTTARDDASRVAGALLRRRSRPPRAARAAPGPGALLSRIAAAVLAAHRGGVPL